MGSRRRRFLPSTFVPFAFVPFASCASFGVLAALAVCASLVTASCAESLPVVDRVQPGAVEKEVFDGEWYFLQTVIDAPHTIEWTTVGEQSLLEKVRWEIDEHYLIARRSYEWIDGGEGVGISGTGEIGAPVAIYAIESHFDIRRDYNTVTGEEQNVLVENTDDRPWYERRFMRVDWSKNLVSEADFLVMQRLWDGVEAESVAYHVEDPRDPDAPRFERGADERVDYVEVTNKMFVKPGVYDFGDDWGEVPVCWLEYSTYIDCAPAELTIRQSFRKVDDADDYQPMSYTGDRMERFGYFVSERSGYDPDYGLVEPRKSYFINRHDLWVESYRKDGTGERVHCASDADCDAAAGSVCDDGRVRAGQDLAPSCTIPFRERQTKPIVYYLSERFPEELVEDARYAVDQWNATFVETVASLRENECLAAGGDAASCAGERTRTDAERLFVLCGNPVAEGEHEACGAPGTVARIGDVRYSLLAWVHDAGLGNPLGFGPSSVDPETGEVVQANAFIYGTGVDELATYGRDLIALLNGDLDAESLVSGENVAAFLDGLRTRDGLAERSAQAHVVEIDGHDAHDTNEAMGLDRLAPSPRRPRARPASRGEMRERMRAAHRAVLSGDVLREDRGQREARITALEGTPVEAMLAGPDMRVAAGLDPRTPLDDTTLRASSPLRGMSPARRQLLARERRRLTAAACKLRAEDFTDEGLVGLAQAVRDAVGSGDGTVEWYGRRYDVGADGGGIDYEKVREMLRHPIFESTTAHEVGHTLGLRHNFAGSYDALNYGARYWELRDDGSMGPRAYDPLTATEIAGRIREHQYSTVMDYGNNFLSTDAQGLGHYDHAAIKMGYGDLVEVFTAATDPSEIAWVHFMQLYGYPVPLKSTSFEDGEAVAAWTYTELPALAGGVAGLEQRADVPYTSLEPDNLLGAEGIDTPLADADGRPAVPYRFCSDELSDLGPDCMLYDAGADQYETVQSIADTYFSYYVFSHFRRQRLGYDIWPVYDRVYWNYFTKLHAANQDYVLNRLFFDEIFAGDPTYDDFYEREDGMGAYTAGVGAAFGMLSRVVATPEPGNYVEYLNADGVTTAYYLDEYYEPEATVALGAGRYLETSWNFDAGYYWVDQLERVGYFYDKILALEILTDPQTYFLGKDEASNTRSYSISFHTTFPEAMNGLLSGMLADRWELYGARPSSTAGEVTFPTISELGAGDAPGVPIDPAAGYSVQLYAAIYAMLFVPLSYDRTFIEEARIWADGSAEAVSIPAVERVEFVDPATSVRYVAASYPDETGAETGLAARMLLHAQALADEGAEVELGEYVDLIRLMRTLSWEYGFGIY